MRSSSRVVCSIALDLLFVLIQLGPASLDRTDIGTDFGVPIAEAQGISPTLTATSTPPSATPGTTTTQPSATPGATTTQPTSTASAPTSTRAPSSPTSAPITPSPATPSAAAAASPTVGATSTATALPTSTQSPSPTPPPAHGAATTITIQGTLLTESGTPISGRSVANSSSFSPCTTSWGQTCSLTQSPTTTDANGAFSVTAGDRGSVRLWVRSSSGSSPFYNSLQAVTVDTSTAVSPITGVVVRASQATSNIATVTVRSSTGAAISNASVSLRIPTDVSTSTQNAASASAGPTAGTYILTAAPGSYTLQVSATGYRTYTASVTVPSSGLTQDVTLELFPVAITGNLYSGTTGTTGISGITLSRSCTALPGQSCSTTQPDSTVADGSFTIYTDRGILRLSVFSGSTYNSSIATLVDATTATSPISGVVVRASLSSANISGTVRSSSGAAISGATVSAAIPVPGSTSTVTAGSTTSDSAGAYTLPVAAGSYTLNSSAVGYSSTSTSVTVASTGLTQNVTLSALPVTITGNLYSGSSGTTGIGGVFLSRSCTTLAGQGCASSQAAITGSDGSFTIQAERGTLRLAVNASAGYNALTAVTVDTTSGSTISGVVVRAAQATSTVSGTIRSTSGSTISGASVSLRVLTDVATSTFAFTIASTSTDAAGAYTLTVAPGTYTQLNVSAAGYHTATPSVTVSSGTLTQNVSLDPYVVTITGRLLTAAGDGISGVGLSAACTALPGQSCSSNQPSSTAPDGSFTLFTDHGTYRLYARSTSGWNSAVAIPVDTTTATSVSGVVVRAGQATSSLTGVVRSNGGTAIAGATVSLSIPVQGSTNTQGAGSATTDATGAYSLPIAAGSYIASVSAPGYRSLSPSPSVTVPTSGLSQDFALVAFPVTVTGRLLTPAGDPISGKSFSRPCTPLPSQTCTSSQPNNTASDGSFTVYLDHATYRFYANASSGYNSSTATLVDATASTTTTISNVVVRASPSTSTIGGTVRLTTGSVLAGASVSIIIPTDGSSATNTTASTTTDTTGAYSLSIAAGTYSFRVSASAAHTLTTTVTVPTSGLPQDAALDPYPVTITGQLLTAAGDGIDGVFLSRNCTGAPAGQSCASVQPTATAADGSFTIYADRGIWDLYAYSSSGYNSASAIPVDATTATSIPGVVVRAAPATTTVTGTISSSAGGTVSGATVAFTMPVQGTTRKPWAASTTTDSSGAYTVKIAPGSYTTYIQAPTFTPLRQSVTFSAAAESRPFTLLAYPVSISGRLVTPTGPGIAGKYLSVSCVPVPGETCTTNQSMATAADGSFTVYGDFGTYRIWAGPSTGYASTVTVLVDATSATSTTGVVVTASPATGAMAGTVRDSGGAPVSGAPVAFVIPVDLTTSTVWAGSTTTDASGNYRLAFVPGSVVARVQASGYHPQQLSVVIPDASTLTQNFTLAPYPVTISGQLLDPAGNGISGVYLSSTCAALPGSRCETYQFARTTANGSFTIYAERGTYWLYAKGGYNSLIAVQVDATNATVISGVTVRATAAETDVTGTVAYSSGGVVAGAKVSFYIPKQNTTSTVTIASALTDASGAYHLNIAPGTYTANASKDGARPLAAVSVTALEDTLTRDFTLDLYALQISGRVVNDAGAGIPGISVNRACFPRPGQTCFSSQPLRSTADGSFEIYADRAIYDLFVRSSNGYNSPRAITVDGRATSRITGVVLIANPSTSTVTGVIEGLDTGGPLAGAKVRLLIPVEGSTRREGIDNTLTDAAGRYVLHASPGSYTLRADADGYRARHVAIRVEGASVTRNLQVIPSGVLIRGRLTTPGGVPIEAVSTSRLCTPLPGNEVCRSNQLTWTRSDGSFEFVGDHGIYTLYVKADEGYASSVACRIDATTNTLITGLLLTAKPVASTVSGTLSSYSGTTVTSGTIEFRIPVVDCTSGAVNMAAATGETVAIATATVDSDGSGGTYSVALPEGSYTVQAAADGQPSPPAASVSVAAGASALDATLADPSGTGSLRVYSDPAVRTTISVGGVPRNDWGLDWVDLAPGDYQLTFGDVRGFFTPTALSVQHCNPTCSAFIDQPVASMVSVRKGETTVVRAPFTPTGFLRVTTSGSGSEPPTIYLQGQPANEWGLWVGLPAGSYTVGFEAISGLTQPCDRTVTITAGATTLVSGNYGTGACDIVSGSAGTPRPTLRAATTGTGLLRVYSDPAVQTTISADGFARDDWGLNWTELAAGDYTLSFSGADGFSAPTSIDVQRCNPSCSTATTQQVGSPITIRSGETTLVRAAFTQVAFLRVVTEGYGSSAPTISIDGYPANEWGLWVALSPGSHTVTFENIAGKAQPCDRTVTLTAGTTTTVTGNYTTGSCAAT